MASAFGIRAPNQPCSSGLSVGYGFAVNSTSPRKKGRQHGRKSIQLRHFYECLIDFDIYFRVMVRFLDNDSPDNQSSTLTTMAVGFYSLQDVLKVLASLSCLMQGRMHCRCCTASFSPKAAMHFAAYTRRTVSEYKAHGLDWTTY